MVHSRLLTLLGVDPDSSGNYSDARVHSWSAVQRHLFGHPNDALIPHTPTRNYAHQQVTPLYIALRNELNPVPVYIIDTLLRIHPEALTDDLIVDVACRNPRMTGECMSRLLEFKPDFVTKRYRWHTPLHAIVRRAQSVEAVQALIAAHPAGLSMRDSNKRIPLHVACCEGTTCSFPIVQLLIEEGYKYERVLQLGLPGGGLFITDENGMSPIDCAIAQMNFLERARSINTDRHMYLNSIDFRNKCYYSWKILVACILGAYALMDKFKGLQGQQQQHLLRWDESKALVAAVTLAGLSKKKGHEYQCGELSVRVLSFIDWNLVFGLLLDPRFCDTHELASATCTCTRQHIPFIIAIENGLTFTDGLLHILKANPDAIFSNDIPESLLPHLMIVLRQKLGLAMMYTLLINSPTVLNRDLDFGHEHQLEFEIEFACSSSSNGSSGRSINNAQDDDDGEQEQPNKKQRAGSIQCL